MVSGGRRRHLIGPLICKAVQVRGSKGVKGDVDGSRGVKEGVEVSKGVNGEV